MDAILIVEDDRKTSALLGAYLRREGFDVLDAADGESALALADHHRPALIILDLVMPRMDGWQVCREIRRGSDVPIIILSSREQEMDRVLGLSLGADDYPLRSMATRASVSRRRSTSCPFRKVIVLRDLEERRTAETARALGVSSNAVKIRLHRARRALRAAILEARQHEGRPGR